ncbi:SDR family oxidoreductase [Niallia sp. FSL W8-1348]|uniref:SDR family oxidoreductase n=1 Tax=Niallia sp. FSL W8-1348 TaxID=2954656 RepID=UPI0030FA2ABF
MKLSGNTILITGGSAGIGLAFAERFIKTGNKVIVCGRREEALQQAKEKFPNLVTYVSDLSIEADRIKLFDWITANYPDVNVLVNNAGIQQRFNVLKADAKTDWSYFNKEITINMEASIQLSMLFAQYFATKKEAAMHSFTVSLRHQLADTSVEVIEVAPPAVNTDLGGAGLHTSGEPLDAFADGIFQGLNEGKVEIGYGSSVNRLRMSRDEVDKHVENMYEAMKKTIE